MRFLLVTTNKAPLPPEVAPSLIDAMRPWLTKHAGKVEQVWSFAGIQGGGGIIDVESLEEMDAFMAEFPLGPFSDITIYPLVELYGSLERSKQSMQAMSAGGRR